MSLVFHISEDGSEIELEKQKEVKNNKPGGVVLQ